MQPGTAWPGMPNFSAPRAGGCGLTPWNWWRRASDSSERGGPLAGPSLRSNGPAVSSRASRRREAQPRREEKHVAHPEEKAPSLEERMEMFLALVEAQDKG